MTSTPIKCQIIDHLGAQGHFSSIRIFLHLDKNPDIYWKPQEVKVWALAETLKLEKITVIRGLNLLRDEGYLIESGRTENNIRKVMLARERIVTSTPHSTPKAS